MADHPFKIKFINPQEIRMGSPYQVCTLAIEGDSILKLKDAAWQNICAWSDDSTYLALIEFNVTDNIPGFHFVVYNTKTGVCIKSERFFGLVNEMEFEKTSNVIKYNKFLYTGQKSESGALIGNSDHEWKFDAFE